MTQNEVRTLRELAKRLDLAHSTVSMALRNHPKIAESTRKRVREAARKYGYIQNPLISNLLTQVQRGRLPQTSLPLALVTVWPRQDRSLETYPFYRELLKGAHNRARELGFYLDELPIDGEEGLTITRIMKIIRARNLSGVLLPPVSISMINEQNLLPSLTRLTQTLPTVSVGLSLDIPGLLRVTPDHFYNANLAVTHLATMGYRRPALVFDQRLDLRTQYRWSAAVRNFPFSNPQLTGMDVNILCFHKSLEPKSFRTWWRKFQPDALIIGDKRITRQTLASIEPESKNCQLITLDQPPDQAPVMMGIDQRPELIGRSAADSLVALINHRNLEPDGTVLGRTIQIEGVWRESKR